MTFADVDKLCILECEKKQLEEKGINTKEDEIKYKVVCEKYYDLNDLKLLISIIAEEAEAIEELVKEIEEHARLLQIFKELIEKKGI